MLENHWKFKIFQSHDILILMSLLKNVENVPWKKRCYSGINTFRFQGVFCTKQNGFNFFLLSFLKNIEILL